MIPPPVKVQMLMPVRMRMLISVVMFYMNLYSVILQMWIRIRMRTGLCWPLLCYVYHWGYLGRSVRGSVESADQLRLNFIKVLSENNTKIHYIWNNVLAHIY